MVSDTGQNRVFIWNQVPATNHQSPDVTLGQVEASGVGRNAGGSATASTLLYPSGLWTDGERLLVADAWNHRVLIWLTFPTQDGQPADVVLGQPDFAGCEPNVEGQAATPSARSLNWPYGLWSDGEALWIADTGNRRVLYFERMPTESYAAADAVIGQPDRVSNGQNQFGWFPEAHTLNWCYDTCFHRGGLWVADTGNSRLLWHGKIPHQNNVPASGLIGQDDFTTGSENKNSL